MSGPDLAREVVRNGFALVLDGASGTLLEDRGIRLDSKLWSAQALVDHPQAVQQLHKDYFEAGANVATTLTYQASIEALKDKLEPTKAYFTLTRGVLEAKEAAVAAKSPMIRLVAASVGPYGAFLASGQEYTGDYGNVTDEKLREFHAMRISALLSGEPDVLLLETMPNLQEIVVMMDILREMNVQIPVWLSLSLKITSTSCVLADGSDLSHVVPLVTSVDVIGANCFPLAQADTVIASLGVFNLPILIYPNSGESYDATSKKWIPSDMTGTWNVEQWYQNGARVFGGCCRTGPADIANIAAAVRLLPCYNKT